VIVPVSFSSR